MTAHNFEAEARATFESCRVGDNMIRVIADKLAANDVRARSEHSSAPSPRRAGRGEG